jgi:hypothetical protein
VERELQHLRRNRFRDELVDRLLALGRTVAAATVLEEDGKLLQAAELLERVPSLDADGVQLCSELYLSVSFDPATTDTDARACRNKATQLLRHALQLRRQAVADSASQDLQGSPLAADQARCQQEAEALANRLLLLQIVSPLFDIPHLVRHASFGRGQWNGWLL